MVNGKVRIKTWEEMENEFGIDISDFGYNSIPCKRSFTIEMEDTLPGSRCITVNEGKWLTFNISNDMISEYIAEDVIKRINVFGDMLCIEDSDAFAVRFQDIIFVKYIEGELTVRTHENNDTIDRKFYSNKDDFYKILELRVQYIKYNSQPEKL